ncbi:MAG: TrmH family RNA methyltransferase [Saprospiraceae bacterium]
MRKLKLEELGRKTIEEHKSASKIPIIVVLDDIRSGGNVGSVFRSADAFLVDRILLCGITPKPPHKEIIKTAIGATHSVDWNYHKDSFSIVRSLKQEGKKIIIIEQTDHSQPLHSFALKGGDEYVIIFGNEVNGVNESLLPLADLCIEIEQFGTKHSLNISVCAGVVFWHLYSQLRL